VLKGAEHPSQQIIERQLIKAPKKGAFGGRVGLWVLSPTYLQEVNSQLSEYRIRRSQNQETYSWWDIVGIAARKAGSILG
jgi:hypothetical protein